VAELMLFGMVTRVGPRYHVLDGGPAQQWGRGTPFLVFSPCPFTIPFFLLFPFLICFTYFLLLSILSTRIVPLCFQAVGRRRRQNLGLVCAVHFVLSVSVLLS